MVGGLESLRKAGDDDHDKERCGGDQDREEHITLRLRDRC